MKQHWGGLLLLIFLLPISNRLYAESNVAVTVGRLAVYSAGSVLLAGASAYMATYAYQWAKETYKQMMIESKVKRTEYEKFLYKLKNTLKVCAKSDVTLLCSALAWACAHYSWRCTCNCYLLFRVTE